MYKIDLHVHTKYSSACGHMSAEELVKGYSEAGYSAIAITDHYCRITHEQLLGSPDSSDALKKFLQGYEVVKAEAEKYGITVYRGAELRFDEGLNDYLLYNYPDWLLENMDEVLKMSLADFYKLSKKTDALLIQAHPYREWCTPAPVEYLDGIELVNMHPWHNSHNELASQFAKENPQFILTGGSDCHDPEHLGRGGILSDTLPKNDKELAELLKSGNYTYLTTNVDK